jgi:hypothetical protein
MDTLTEQDGASLGDTGTKPKVKRDYSQLKSHQLAVSRSELFTSKGGQIRDDNPPGYTQRTYEQLAKIKMPLILDELIDDDGKPRTPWTIDQILSAMQPTINSIANKYARRRAGFQPDEAFSLGQEAVLAALWRDLGLAWFAGYCYDKIEAAIARGSKISDTIRTSESKQPFRLHIRSLDDTFGEGDGTLSEVIGAGMPKIGRERCGDHYRLTPQKRYEVIKDALPFLNLSADILAKANEFNKAESRTFDQPNLTPTGYSQLLKDFRSKLAAIIGSDAAKLLVNRFIPEGARRHGRWVTKGAVGAVFSPSCSKGKLLDGTLCGRCGGTGRMTVFTPQDAKTPDELVDDKVKLEEAKRIFELMTSTLTDTQKLALMLHRGFDNDGRPREVSEVAEIFRERDREEQVGQAKTDLNAAMMKLMAETVPAKRATLTFPDSDGNPVPAMVWLKQKKEFIATYRGCGSKNRISQMLNGAYAKIKAVQAKSADITNAIDRILDEPSDT